MAGESLPTERTARGFQLLETILLRDGDYWLLDRHLTRLKRSAAHFGFALALDVVRRALSDFSRLHPRGAWRVRLLSGADGGVSLEGGELEPVSERTVRAALATEPVARSDPFLYYKTTRRSVYDRFIARHPGVFDVLLWNENAEVTEFTRGNVVVELDGKRWTPPVFCGLLNGTLRQELLAVGEIDERVIRVEHLCVATGVWFINSVRGQLAVELQPDGGSATGG